jgi:hypothetical protein
MKSLLSCFAVTVMVMTLACAGSAVASEYYVVKSRSGVVRIVDHQPKGRASIVKGPFVSKEEAETAMKSLSDAMPLNNKMK